VTARRAPGLRLAGLGPSDAVGMTGTVAGPPGGMGSVHVPDREVAA
jgi:hypothetical protein